MHILDLGLYSHPKEFLGGMEFEPMLTPREKSPLPENVPRGGSNPRRCGQRAQALPTELFRPPFKGDDLTLGWQSNVYGSVCCLVGWLFFVCPVFPLPCRKQASNKQAISSLTSLLAFFSPFPSCMSYNILDVSLSVCLCFRLSVPVSPCLGWLLYRAAGITESVLGLADRVSVYCDWVR